MAMVMPRAFSSGALSISSKGVKVTVGSFSARHFVIAAVSVVLPWSMCPIVPMLRCGFVRSNFCLAIEVPLAPYERGPLLTADPSHDLTRDRLRDLLIRV